MLHENPRPRTAPPGHFLFGRGRCAFRLPRPDFGRPFLAVLGGSEAYGPGVERPFAALLAERLGIEVANFGLRNAGPDAPLADPLVLGAACRARAAVVALPGARNLSNRLYRVHRFHNDRLIDVSPALRALYDGIAYHDIAYTGHLLAVLHAADPERFRAVVAELRAAWVARMRQLLETLGGRAIVLWMSDAPPADPLDPLPPPAAWRHPMLVDQDMVDALAGWSARIVECVVPPADRPPDGAAADPEAHAAAAEALAPHVAALMAAR